MNGMVHCGALVARLQQEHHELNRELIAIRDLLPQLGQGQPLTSGLAALANRLARLADHLQAHFAEEENGGCMAEVLDRCPSLAPQVRAMLQEHPALLKSLMTLIANVNQQQATAQKIVQEFEAFAKALRTHEATENRLLQMALGGDAADYDTEGNE